jgi:hypothetical protein
MDFILKNKMKKYNGVVNENVKSFGKTRAADFVHLLLN